MMTMKLLVKITLNYTYSGQLDFMNIYFKLIMIQIYTSLRSDRILGNVVENVVHCNFFMDHRTNFVNRREVTHLIRG